MIVIVIARLLRSSLGSKSVRVGAIGNSVRVGAIGVRAGGGAAD